MIRALRALLLAVLLALLGFTGLRWGGGLRVREVRVNPTRYAPVEKLTGRLLGANILRLDLTPLWTELSADPRILGGRARVNFFYLRLELEIRERSPLVALEVVGRGRVWVDREGVILEPAGEARVRAEERAPGRVAPEVVAAALAWEQLPPALAQRFPVLDLTGGEALAPGPPVLRLGAICQVPEKLGILVALWREGLLEGKGLVDLRFRDIVVLKRAKGR
ncbi:MAG: hypothetical protein NZ924_03430 [Candidatus Bipolaricaulota bacterium]|nr:hypothetical protein [Candidatus Bipolaricaulota bacterium]MDW8151959.1 hypothetical protein [Candidatus Bipolaricaulota bacterium]